MSLSYFKKQQYPAWLQALRGGWLKQKPYLHCSKEKIGEKLSTMNDKAEKRTSSRGQRGSVGYKEDVPALVLWTLMVNTRSSCSHGNYCIALTCCQVPSEVFVNSFFNSFLAPAIGKWLLLSYSIPKLSDFNVALGMWAIYLLSLKLSLSICRLNHWASLMGKEW